MATRKDPIATAESLLHSIKEGHFVPLYLLYGEEDFLVGEAVDALVESALDASSRSFNLDVVYGGDIDVKDVVGMASSFPMMSERRVVIVKDADRLSLGEEARGILLRYLQKPLQSTILVFAAAKVDMRLGVYKAFQEFGVAAEFRSLYDSEIPAWISKRVATLRRKIDLEASQYLSALVGSSLRDIHNALEKLLIYVGERTSITVEDVGAVVGMSKSFNIFGLQKEIGRGNAREAFEILERMLEAGENPIGIIIMLTRYYQKLWIIPTLQRNTRSEYELASALQVSPFFVREYVSAAQRHRSGEIEKAFTALLDADRKLKSSPEDPKLVMTTLAHALLKPAGEIFEYDGS
jgi:DNA polymerase-3 subunit delta